jgi:enoyl-CoA hydratase/carnithine racemase
MAEPAVTLQTGRVATITFNRPEAANCLNRAALGDLAGAIAAVRDDPAVRAVVLTGDGDKAFCAGADLKERAGMSDDEVRDFISTIRDTLTALQNLPQPVVAAINGGAFGGGCEAALACDIRVMAETATIGLTETSLAIIPGGGGTQRLPRLVGLGRALELILTARRIDASEALMIGLVQEVSAHAKTRAHEIAERIAANGPVAVRAAKEAILAGADLPLQEALRLESKLYERTLGTADRWEGLKAFVEKRKPEYKGE